MPRVHFRKENVTVDALPGVNLRKLCLDYGIDPYPALGGLASCRGKGLCGTCVVGIEGEDGCLSAPSARETKALGRLPAHMKTSARLSCLAIVEGDVTVNTDPDRRPAWKRHGFYAGRPGHSWDPAS